MHERKKELHITIDKDLLKYIKENYTNRSNFIEHCIVEELKRYNKKQSLNYAKTENS